MSDRYVFKQDRDTKQVHIYRVREKENGKSEVFHRSECGSRESANGDYNPKEYNENGRIKTYNEDGARRHCPNYGRPLCGRCVSTLYTDYDEDE